MGATIVKFEEAAKSGGSFSGCVFDGVAQFCSRVTLLSVHVLGFGVGIGWTTKSGSSRFDLPFKLCLPNKSPDSPTQYKPHAPRGADCAQAFAGHRRIEMISLVGENQLIQLRTAQAGDGTFLTRLGQPDIDWGTTGIARWRVICRRHGRWG